MIPTRSLPAAAPPNDPPAAPGCKPLIGALDTLIHQATAANHALFEWPGLPAELTPLHANASDVLVSYTLPDSPVIQTALLAHLLILNRTLFEQAHVPTCLSLDQSGQRVQFLQRAPRHTVSSNIHSSAQPSRDPPAPLGLPWAIV